MAQTVERVIEVISKDTGSRLDHEIEAIAPLLRKRSQLLQGLEKSVLSDILRNCDYQRSQKDDVIIRQCEIGETFYIILRGTVSVYIDSQMSGEDNIATIGAPLKGVEIDKQSKKRKPVSKLQSPVKNVSGANRAKFGKFIVKFEPGKSFGEIALLTKGSTRNASIIVDEDTDFLVVHRDLFNRCLKEHEEREFAAIRDFVDTHPFFSLWQRRLKRFLEMSVRKEVYEYNSVIVKQGEPVRGLYFIYQGQAKMLVDPTKHKNQYRRLWPFEAVTDLYAQEFEWLREARKRAIAKKYDQDPTVLQTKNDSLMVRRLEGYAAAERLVHGRTITLCTVNNMEVIGGAEVVSKLDTYMETVVCSSNTEVYVLDMKNFERLVLKKNPATLQVIKDIVSDKLFSRMNTHQGRQIPLLKYLHFKLNEENYQSSKELPPLKTTKSLPDAELLQKYLVKAFIEGKSQICEPHVPGMTYYRELMQDKARIRENIRVNQGLKRHREKLYSEKLKNRKPRSSAALKEALELMEEDDMIGWREQIGKDFLEMIVPPTKNISKPQKDRPKGKRILKTEKSDKKFSNVTFHFTSRKDPHKSTEPQHVEMSETGTAGTNGVSEVKSHNDTSEQDHEISTIAQSQDISIPSEDSELKISKEPLASIVNDTEGADSETQSPRDTQDSVKPSSKPVMVTHLTAIREESYVYPDQGTEHKNTQLGDKEATPGLPPSIDEGLHPDFQEEGSTEERIIQLREKSGENLISMENAIDEEPLPQEKAPLALKEGGHLGGASQHNKSAEVQNLLSMENGIDEEPLPQEKAPLVLNEGGHLGGASQHNKSTEAQNDEKTVSAGGRAWGLTRQFVQQKIEKKKQESTLFDDRYSEYKDYETSERTLNFLENRLRAFHLKYSTSRRPIKLPKLRRFKVDQDELYRTMRQGGRVKIKRRACDLSQSEYKIKDHQHVHYHMVPKLVQVQDLRKTRLVMQFMVDNSVRKGSEGDTFVIPTGNDSGR